MKQPTSPQRGSSERALRLARGWHVPLGVQLLFVAVITLGLISLAARVFKTTE